MIANAITVPRNVSRSWSRVAAGCALAAAALSAHAGIEVLTSGTTFFKRAVTNTDVQTLSSTVAASANFANVPGTPTTVFVPAGSTVLISVDFNAEAACYGGGVGSPNWCELMVLIGGVEGSPQASTTSLGDTYAFATTDSSEATSASWRGHALSRHRCVRNTSNVPMAVPVATQWKIVNFSAAAAPATTFWLDDSAMVVQMSSGCTVQTLPSVADGLAPVPGTAQGERR